MEKFKQYLQSKNLAQSSITHYTDYTQKFFNYIQKEAEQVEKKDILKYLQYLKSRKGYENITRKNRLIALNHYFTFLYKNQQLKENPCLFLKIRGTKKRSLYKTYTPEQLEQFYDNYYHSFVRNFDEKCFASRLGGIPANQRQQARLSRQRNYIVLGFLIYQGLATNEIQKITLADINLAKATVNIAGGKKRNARTIPLNASQIGALIHYIENIRPQFFTYCDDSDNYRSDKLFFTLPESSRQKTSSTTLMYTFKLLSQQVKTLDATFLNFRQIRASVITHWLKTYGLRKAQYYAGHRYISSTENYLPNNLEGLINDIDKLHPF